MKMLIGRAPAALIAVLLLLDGFVLLAHLQAPTIERTIGPADIVSREGHAYIVALREVVGWLYELPTDGPDVEASTLQILHGASRSGRRMRRTTTFARSATVPTRIGVARSTSRSPATPSRRP